MIPISILVLFSFINEISNTVNHFNGQMIYFQEEKGGKQLNEANFISGSPLPAGKKLVDSSTTLDYKTCLKLCQTTRNCKTGVFDSTGCDLWDEIPHSSLITSGSQQIFYKKGNNIYNVI
jgi:hypothetical protein